MQNSIKLIEIGNYIRKWRQLKGMKQDGLASEIEISKVSISKIETGRADISLLRLFAIASALQIQVQLLFSDPSTLVRENENS